MTDRMILHLRLCLLLLLPGFFTSHLYAQEFQVDVKTDRQGMLIGDQLDLRVSARYNPMTHRVQFPTPPDTFHHFELLSKGKVDTIRQEPYQRIVQHYQITCFDSGRWEIPSMDFTVQPLQGDTPFVLKSQAFLVDVQTVAVDTSKPFKPIMGIRPAELPDSVILKYVLIGLLALLIVGLLTYFLIRKLRKKKSSIPEVMKPQLLPHEKALQHLLDTEQKALWAAGEEKTYYTEIADTMRTYLEEQFGIDSFEKTTAEIVQQVKRQRILNPFRQTLRELLQLADLVKFAKAKPTEEDHRQAMQQARDFVQSSYQKIKQQQAVEHNETKA